MSDLTLGQKIKYFRKRAGYTQMKLELETEAAFGSISRIESGQVNPTKETLTDIGKVLELETAEIAFLFGIENFLDITELIKETNKIILNHDLKEVLNQTVNNLIFKMGYLASMIFMVDNDNDKVNFCALTKSNLSIKALKCLDRPFSSLYLSLKRDTDNFTVKAIKENKIYLTDYTYQYIAPAVSKKTADEIQAVSGDKSNLIVPLCTKNKPFGAIAYAKKVLSDFKDEKKTIEVISKQIAIAIQNAKIFGSY